MTDREAFEQWLMGKVNGGEGYLLEDVWQAALAYARQVPDGFKLVPVEPTEEMLKLGENALGLIDTRWDGAPMWDVWNAMLAASPPAPPTAGEGE